MSTIRKVTATAPESTNVVPRQSKTKIYTHALAVFFPAREAQYSTGWFKDLTEEQANAKPGVIRVTKQSNGLYEAYAPGKLSVPAYDDHWSIISFHTSEELALKAGRNAWTKPTPDQIQAVPVTVVDEGFNA